MKHVIVIFSIVAFGFLFFAIEFTGADAKQNPAGAIDWRGVYTFGEVGAKNSGMVIDYSLTIYQKDGALVADLDADGFQTLTRVSCSVKATDNKIQIFFERPRKDNLYDIYKPGDLLFALEARNGKLLTYWGAITPQLTSYKNGRVYFIKQMRRRAN
jgi:hypothetical protein